MYTASFGVDDPGQTLQLLRSAGFGHLITFTETDDGIGGDRDGDGFGATAIPFVVDESVSVVRAHVARANAHWRDIDGVAAILIVPVADVYVSPRWYPSKAEHGRVVPTSNYGVVHVRGQVTVHHDAAWKLDLLNDLTDQNEASVIDGGNDSWCVADAPGDFIDKQLKAIVGIELTVTAVQSKLKLSQNRSEADRAGVLSGLSRSDDPRSRSIAALMT